MVRIDSAGNLLLLMFTVEFRKALVGKKVFAVHPTEADKPEECAMVLMR